MNTQANLRADLRSWFRLDNAGKVFPGQNTSTWSNVFRMTAVMDEKADPEILKSALWNIMKRFPCFDAEIHRGLFWYYLEENKNAMPPVLPDIKNPCTRVNFRENGGFLFRVYYHENRISVEFYHALTDAYGVSRFLCTLIAEYLRLRGNDIPAGGAVLDINEKCTDSEMEDSFAKFASSNGRVTANKKSVYHPHSQRLPAHTVNVITGYIDMDGIKAESKKYGVTITEFVTAVMTYTVYKKQLSESRRQKLISAQVPVNLRNSFPSHTLRNFSLCYQIDLDPNLGEYTFEEIVKHTALTLRCINDPKRLNAMMTHNVKMEHNVFARLTPLFLKNLIMKIYFGIGAENTTSLLFSNMGKLDVPDEMKKHVSTLALIPPHGIKSSARSAAIGYNGILSISFTNVFEQCDIEREFFRTLVKMGIHVKVESNRD